PAWIASVAKPGMRSVMAGPRLPGPGGPRIAILVYCATMVAATGELLAVERSDVAWGRVGAGEDLASGRRIEIDRPVSFLCASRGRLLGMLGRRLGHVARDHRAACGRQHIPVCHHALKGAVAVGNRLRAIAESVVLAGGLVVRRLRERDRRRAQRQGKRD